MFGKIKRLLGLSASQEPMHRWSPEKLATIKTYLETKSADLFTKDDHYLAVEWLAQRYLPADIDRTEADHRQSLESLYRKVDANISRVERGETEPSAEIAPDPDFAAWMRNVLMAKIDRDDISKMLDCFDRPDEHSHQADAIRSFTRWINNPDHFHIDADLRVKIEDLLKKWGRP